MVEGESGAALGASRGRADDVAVLRPDHVHVPKTRTQTLGAFGILRVSLMILHRSSLLFHFPSWSVFALISDFLTGPDAHRTARARERRRRELRSTADRSTSIKCAYQPECVYH